MKTVLLVSGGLDSYIAYYYLIKDGYEVLPLHINYQGIYSNKELSVVEELFPNVSTCVYSSHPTIGKSRLQF